MKFKIVMLLLIFTAAGLMYYSSLKPDILLFNDTMIDAMNLGLENATEPINTANNWCRKNKIDIIAFQKSLTKWNIDISRAERKIDKIKVPNYDECREFKSTIREYLIAQKDLVQGYQAVFKRIKNNNPSKKEDVTFVLSFITSPSERAATAYIKLQAIQEKIAIKFKYEKMDMKVDDNPKWKKSDKI